MFFKVHLLILRYFDQHLLLFVLIISQIDGAELTIFVEGLKEKELIQ